MLSPAARFLVLTACLIPAGGCAVLGPITTESAGRSESGTATHPGDERPAAPAQPATTADDPAAAPTDGGATAAKPTAAQSPGRGIRVTVLDPTDFAQALDRHLQALIRSSGDPLAPDEVGFYLDIQNAQLVQVLRSTSIEIRREEDLIVLTIPGGESFERNSAEIKSEAKEVLTRTAQILLEYSQTRITIHGHTDDSGEAAYNQQLSIRRALSIADHLLSARIAPARIAVVGFGESRPLGPNASADDRARNRRVELYLQPITR